MLIFSLFTTAQQHNVGHGGGTTILTIIKPDSIIIAADSRHTRHYFDGRIIIDTVSKVNQLNNIFYCFSGTTDIFYRSTKVFNAYDILSSCLKKNWDFKKVLLKFNARLNSAIPKMFKYVGPRYFFDSLPGRSLLQIVLVRFRDNKPEYAFGDYQITGNKKSNLYVQYFEDLFDSTAFFNEAGYHDHIDSFLKANPGFLATSTSITASLVKLIKMESERHPEKVACPIDIVVIKNGTKEWLKNSFYCD